MGVKFQVGGWEADANVLVVVDSSFLFVGGGDNEHSLPSNDLFLLAEESFKTMTGI